MGSLSDLWLEPSQDADLARVEAHERLRKLVARLDRLTADPLEPTQPRRMLRVGQSSSDLEGEASATNEAVRFGSSRVRWEPIDGFVSPGEYRSFVSWITDRLADGRAEEVEVEANLGGVTSQSERWFRHVATGEVWRLVEPDPPSRGLFIPVNPNDPSQ